MGLVEIILYLALENIVEMPPLHHIKIWQVCGLECQMDGGILIKLSRLAE